MNIEERENRADGKVELLKYVPKDILNKIISGNKNGDNVDKSVEVVIISGGNVDNISQFVDKLGGKYEDLGYGFGIVTISIDKIGELIANTEIQYVEFPLTLVTTDTQSNKAACVIQAQSTFNLDGAGVLVGFIDSGIDYTHPAFRNEDGTTRIEYIYDLNFGGKVYDKKIINEALKSTDPLSVVNVVDLTEHGTHVAGIACAGGNIPSQYYGVAPKSSIAMVKTTRGRFTLSTQLMRGLKFLIDKSKELKMPLAVNISLSTNEGAHNGSSLLEKYISTLSGLERATIVIAAGNEGESAHHVQGQLLKVQNIDINMASDESIITINLYKPVLSNITIELVSPTGDSSGELEVNQTYKDGAIGADKYFLFATGPKPFDISGEIIIGLSSLSEYLTIGKWRMILRLKNNNSGKYDIWLPISEGLNTNTKFLQPSVFNTLGIPATVNNIIAVGSYNYQTNTVSAFSGRGVQTEQYNIRPDIVAPGENIYSTVPDRRFDAKTGTSMATPHVTGICALLMQWGIVKGNDPYLYGERLKYYLIEGAKRNRSDVKYPDPSWGYGTVCAYDSLDIVRRIISSNIRHDLSQGESTQNTIVPNSTDKPSEINISVQSESNMQDLSEAITNDIRVEEIPNNTSKIDSTEANTKEIEDIFTDRVAVFIEIASQEVFDEISSIPGVDIVSFGFPFALVLIPIDKFEKIKELSTKVIISQYLEIYTLSAISPVEASGAPIFYNNPYLNLTGDGVLIGIVDTGIDYLNEEFTYEDNTSKIFRLWDQTLVPSGKVLGLEFGKEFTKEEINEALKLKVNGGDPYSKVPSKDTIGHGTMVAGIAGGRGKNPELIGAAPGSEFIIVKLQQVNKYELDYAFIDSKTPSYSAARILLAIRYIASIANQFKKPVVIYVPLGSNLGPHSGYSNIGNIAETFTRQIGTVFVVPTGNQGDTETHTEGRFSRSGEIKTIELKVGEKQKILPMQIWVNKPDTIILSIVSPSGESVESLIPKITKNTKIKFVYEGTEMVVSYIFPEITTGDTLITIHCTNLKPGIWKFRMLNQKVVDGRYFSWIPQRELIQPDTKFLSPSELSTLTVPSGANSIISVAYYNQNNNASVGASGRGYATDGRIKPDIAAGGVDAIVTKPGGGTMVASGSSIAGAVVAGGCALILQYGTINKNSEDLYATSIRSYIIKGAKGRSGDIYPNQDWGYGIFDLAGIFEVMRGGTRLAFEKDDKFDEYAVNGLFIRKPKEI